MIRLEGKWVGLDTVAAEEFVKLHAPAERAVLKGALYFERKVKQKLTGDRSGREYRIGKRGRTYTASAPGEPPASKSGALRQSITHTMPEWTGDIVSSEVGTAQPYARILEYGGLTGRDHATRILPRPYFGSTFVEEEAAINDILAEAVVI